MDDRDRSRLALFSLVAVVAILACPGIGNAQQDCRIQMFPPFITGQPQSQTISSGAQATLTTTADSFPPGCPLLYEYQIRTGAQGWSHVVFGGNSYTTPPLTTTQQYRAIVEHA
jgi:hypothetical protein